VRVERRNRIPEQSFVHHPFTVRWTGGRRYPEIDIKLTRPRRPFATSAWRPRLQRRRSVEALAETEATGSSLWKDELQPRGHHQ
jgi:hypothetical protein